MPSITVTVMPPFGPMVNAFINFSTPRVHAIMAAGGAQPVPQQGRFLIDTGASHTCVDPGLIANIGLPLIGKTGISTPSTNGGSHMCNQYDAALIIMGDQGGMVVPVLPIIETHLKSQGFDGLIGRDVLDTCTLIYMGQSKLFQLNY